MDKNPPVILIPARYDSMRFPGKPLADIAGLSLIRRVWDNCQGHKSFVVTDDDRIEAHVRQFGGQVLRIDEPTASGGDRIFLAWQRHLREHNPSLIINLQGDWPLIDSGHLKTLIAFHQDSGHDVATLVCPQEGQQKRRLSSGSVKVILAKDGRCLYFSRAPIPHGATRWLLHLGIYSYRPLALERFAAAGPSWYEQTEGLEQLRLLESGMSIAATSVEGWQMGVDTPEDVLEIKRLLG